MATSMSDEFRESDIELKQIDFPCMPCSKIEKQVESLQYCEDCKEYLCEQCIDYHERFSMTSNHKVGVFSKTLIPPDRIKEIAIPYDKTKTPQREITGMCFVRRGNHFLLVFTDWYAQSIKILDVKTSMIVDVLSMGTKPYAVGYLPDSRRLVCSLRDKGEVAFIALSDEIMLKIINFEKVSKSCRGLDVVPGIFNDSVVVGSGGHKSDGHRGTVEMYSVAFDVDGGKLFGIKLFSIPTKKRDPPFVPKNAAVDIKNKRIYVTDAKLGVVGFDKDGKRVASFSDPCLSGPRALCVDDEGHVYVGGTFSANIVKFSPDGKCLGEITNKRFGLKSPICMCYDKISNSIAVGSKDDHVIRILKL